MTATTLQAPKTLRSSEARDIITRWYHGLHSEHKRGERAQLRRCEHPNEVLWHPEYYALLQQLEAENISVRSASERGSDDEIRLAALVSLLSHVKENRGGQRLGQQFRRGNSGQRGLSDLRFRRLIAAQTPTEALKHFRRAIHLVDNAVNVTDLVRALASWGPDPTYAHAKDNPRIRLAEEFYGL